MKAARAALMILSSLFVLIPAAAAPSEHVYFVTNSGVVSSSRMTNVCTVTARFADGSSNPQEIIIHKTGTWTSSKCLSTLEGTCRIFLTPSGSASIDVSILTLSGQNICTDARYEIRWDDTSARNPSFVKTQ